jgi:two-component system, NarL family, response regulator LiaR
MTVRVLIIDDHLMFSEVVSWALESRDMEIVGAVPTAAEGIEACERTNPDIVLMDLRLPDLNGVEAGKIILEQQPDTKIVAVTALDDSASVQKVRRAGFHGYVAKDSSLDQFADAIEAVLQGETVMPHRFGRSGERSVSREDETPFLLVSQLTERELEVLTLLTKGATSEDIGTHLSVSANTVRSHVQNLLTKLQVHSRLEAVAFAARHREIVDAVRGSALAPAGAG